MRILPLLITACCVSIATPVAAMSVLAETGRQDFVASQIIYDVDVAVPAATPTTDGTLHIHASGDFVGGMGLGRTFTASLDFGSTSTFIGIASPFAFLTNGAVTYTQSTTSGSEDTVKATFIVPQAVLAGIVSDGVINFGFLFPPAAVTPGTGQFEASLSYSAVPEPSSLALIAIGSLVGGGALLRRRRTSR